MPWVRCFSDFLQFCEDQTKISEMETVLSKEIYKKLNFESQIEALFRKAVSILFLHPKEKSSIHCNNTSSVTSHLFGCISQEGRFLL